MTPYQSKRESLSRDDAKLLLKIVQFAKTDGASLDIDMDSERIEFILAKLKRLSK